MKNKLIRVGTNYIPVRNSEASSSWYTEKLGAEITYIDKEKAILNLANQSFFLIGAHEDQSSNFYSNGGNLQFSLTFEVDGLPSLYELFEELSKKGVRVDEIEERGHAGKNFCFYDLDGNKFDVWSELSPRFKEKYL